MLLVLTCLLLLDGADRSCECCIMLRARSILRSCAVTWRLVRPILAVLLFVNGQRLCQLKVALFPIAPWRCPEFKILVKIPVSASTNAAARFVQDSCKAADAADAPVGDGYDCIFACIRGRKVLKRAENSDYRCSTSHLKVCIKCVQGRS